MCALKLRVAAQCPYSKAGCWIWIWEAGMKASEQLLGWAHSGHCD